MQARHETLDSPEGYTKKKKMGGSATGAASYWLMTKLLDSCKNVVGGVLKNLT